MAAVTYPTTLPAPSQWQGVPRERRAASSSPGNTQLRNRSRDAVHDIDAQWFYTSAEMVIWRAWYETTLLDGMLWFAATVPGAGGWVQRVAKFRTKSLKDEYIGNGVYRVSAQLQQRGISAAPQVAEIPQLLYFEVDFSDSSSSNNDTAYLQLNGADWSGYISYAGYVASSADARYQVAVMNWEGTVSVAIDRTTGNVWFGHNGTWLGALADPATGVNPALTGYTGAALIALVYQAVTSFGSATLRTTTSEFVYAPPTGFSAYGGADPIRWDPTSSTGNYTFSNNDLTASINTTLGVGQSRSVSADRTV